MTTKRAGANGAANTVAAVTSFLQSPAANGFAVSQKLALESTRLWAKRMRAYADHFEALANCQDANQMLAAQASFVERMQQDYVAEGEIVRELIAKPERGEARPQA